MNQSIEALDTFCGTPFWNASLTWNTTNPDFTICFEKTALVFIPVGFFWTFLPLEIIFLKRSQYRDIGRNWRYLLKRLILFVLVLICICDFFSNAPANIPLQKVNIFMPIVKLITFATCGVLAHKNTRNGYRGSGHQFLFWLLCTICGIPQFRSELQRVSGEFISENVFSDITYLLYFPLVCCMLILNSISEGVPRIMLKKQKESPIKEYGFLGKLLYIAYGSILYKGFRKPLEFEDTWYLDYENRAENIVPLFENEFKRRQEYNTKKNSEFSKKRHAKNANIVSALSVLFACFYPAFLIGILCRLVGEFILFINPQILRLLISFIGSDEPMWKGYLYAISMFIFGSTHTLINNTHMYNLWLFSIRSQTAIRSAIYRKALRISNATKKDKTVGEIVNIMAVDANRFQDFSLHVPALLSAPLQLALSLYFLWQEVGPSILAGFAVMILLIPLNVFIVRQSKKLQVKQMKDKDERVKMMNEVLNGIKVLKLYAWEPSFERIVEKIRVKEIKTILLMNYLNAVAQFVWNMAPFLVSFVTFATYVLIDENNVLDAPKVFVSLSLLNILRAPLNQIPTVMSTLVQTAVALKRINAFLNADELDPYIEHDRTEGAPIVVENGTFSWGEKPILKNIHFRIPNRSLTAIVGPVGCGKSSLISVLLGEMDKESGRVNLYGDIAYVPQLAWIQNGTVKENIIFGSEFDKRRYKKVIEACALEPDFEMLADGDLTEIGEKGINLSGGQKQRISLARAVYNDADIYLLDDPLSAVDSHVGKHIFEQVLSSTGLLKNKVRVLVTHGITYLPKTDRVLVMKDGRITESGSYKELLSKGGAFAEFLMQHISEENVDESELDEIEEQLEETPIAMEIKRKISRQRSHLSECSDTIQNSLSSLSMSRESLRLRRSSSKKRHSDTSKLSFHKFNQTEKGKLIEIENAETGNVKMAVYKYYLSAVSPILITFTVLCYCGFQGFGIASNTWLGFWAEDTDVMVDGKVNTGLRNMYLGIYGALGIIQGICILVADTVFAKGTTNAATKLHGKLVNAVMHLPMQFFDITPCGRILARFSSDVVGVDQRLPSNFNNFFGHTVKVLGSIAIICYTTPIFTAVLVPIGVIYVFIERYFVATSRQIKRLESVTRSPVYSHFGETLSGTTVIRAYRSEDRFIEESDHRVDNSQRCLFLTVYGYRWLGIRLETIGNIIILTSAIFSILSKDINPAMVGLSVSYALQITNNLNMLIRTVAEVESNIVSVERIKEYTEKTQEKPWEISERKPNQLWPDTGNVQFKDYCVRYRAGLDLVLKGISFNVQGGEKIGIVGRTGAGKSSLTLSLFRIIEAAEGKIIIDGINISEIGLHDLRSKLTIIPQDSILFSGSLRLNLDPFDMYSDAEVWKALELAHLKDFINGLPSGLYHKVSEGGENLSAGQRQLLCLARALLRKTKILILDEATAAVDLETDDLIQKTIRTEFADCTVITIAHRLNTIVDSNRVLVLDKGKIAEFEAPQILLQNKESIFYGMCKDAGLVI